MNDVIGVIGGSGLYLLDGFEGVRDVVVETPFGPTSDAISVGSLGGHEVAFLPRHGRGHRLLPSEVPYLANVWAMKSLGVSRVFSVSAVGSMKESIALSKPVLVDQFIDRTVNRRSTFFGDGIVGHVSMADPTCGALRGLLESAAQRVGVDVVQGGTYVCMEGPQFSSRAESLQYRQLGVDVIGMTNATEAKLAREAGICYATIAIPTDFDCWHRSEADVTVEAVIARLSIGIGRARLMVLAAIDSMGEVGPCRCRDALVGAIMTDPARISQQTKSRLAPILGSLLS